MGKNKTTKKIKCEFYPCHFKGQDCTFCYCPLYPCYNPDWGKFVKIKGKYKLFDISKGKLEKVNKIWDCSKCEIFHYPYIVNKIKETIKEKKNG